MNRVLVITSIVTAVAVLIYTVFAGLQWWAIRKQAEHTANQALKMQGQLDEMKRQAGLMEKGLGETRKMIEQNERAVETAEESTRIARRSFHSSERPHFGITGVTMNFEVGRAFSPSITIRNGGRSPACTSMQCQELA